MDMRDPWSLQPWLRESVASPIWYRHAERFERACIARASLVVANTAPAHAALVALYPDASAKTITVMNGSDDDPLPPHRDSERFVIRYAGTIYLDRDPQTLFRAAAKVIASEKLEPAQFGIDILGRFADEHRVPLLGMAAQEGIADYVSVEPPRPHREALDFLAGATMLVIFPGQQHARAPGQGVRVRALRLVAARAGGAGERDRAGARGHDRGCGRAAGRRDGRGDHAAISRSPRGYAPAACGARRSLQPREPRRAFSSTRSRR